jgi:hypothetical protein
MQVLTTAHSPFPTGELLRELMLQHSRPESIARYRRVVSLMQATEEVASVMGETVDRLLANSQV